MNDIDKWVAEIQGRPITAAQEDPMDAMLREAGGVVGSEETGIGTELTRGLGRGLKTTKGLAVAATGAVLKTLGADDLGESWIDDYKQIQREIQARPAAKVGRVEDIQDAGDFANWAATMLSENVTTIGAMMASGGVAGVLGAIAKKKGQDMALGSLQKAALNGFANHGYAVGVGVPSVTLGIGEVYGEQRENGLDSPGLAIAAGTLMGAFDALGATQVAKAMGFGGGFQQKFLETLSGMSKKKKIAVLGLGAAGAEGVTESLQEVVAISARAFIDENYLALGEESVSRLMNAAAGGALVGGTLGSLGAAVKGPNEPEAPALEDVGSPPEVLALPAPEGRQYGSRRRAASVNTEIEGQSDAIEGEFLPGEQPLLEGGRQDGPQRFLGNDPRDPGERVVPGVSPLGQDQGGAVQRLTWNPYGTGTREEMTRDYETRPRSPVETADTPAHPAANVPFVHPGSYVPWMDRWPTEHANTLSWQGVEEAMLPVEGAQLQMVDANWVVQDLKRGFITTYTQGVISRSVPSLDVVMDGDAFRITRDPSTPLTRTSAPALANAIDKVISSEGFNAFRGDWHPRARPELKNRGPEDAAIAEQAVVEHVREQAVEESAGLDLKALMTGPATTETTPEVVAEPTSEEAGLAEIMAKLAEMSDTEKAEVIADSAVAAEKRKTLSVRKPLVKSAERLEREALEADERGLEEAQASKVEKRNSVEGAVPKVEEESALSESIRLMEERKAKLKSRAAEEIVTDADNQKQLEADMREGSRADREGQDVEDERFRQAEGKGGLNGQEALDAVAEFQEAFPNVVIVPYFVTSEGVAVTADGSSTTLHEAAAEVSGYYRRKEGIAYVNLSAHRTISELQRTMMHEGIVHNGFWKILNEGERKAVLNVLKKQIDLEGTADALGIDKSKEGWQDLAAEEYLAYTAERGPKIWDRVYALVARAIRRVYKGFKFTNSELRLMVEDWARVFQSGELNQFRAQRLPGHFIPQGKSKHEQLLYPIDSNIPGLARFQKEANGNAPVWVTSAKVLDVGSERGQAQVRKGATGWDVLYGVDETFYVGDPGKLRDPYSGDVFTELDSVPQGAMNPTVAQIDTLFRLADEGSVMAGGRILPTGPISDIGRQAIKDINELMGIWKTKSAQIFMTPLQIKEQAKVAQIDEYMGKVEAWWADKTRLVSEADDVMKNWQNLGKGGAQRVAEMLFAADNDSVDKGRKLTTEEIGVLAVKHKLTDVDMKVFLEVKESFSNVVLNLETGIIEAHLKQIFGRETTPEILEAAGKARGNQVEVEAQLKGIVPDAQLTLAAKKIVATRQEMKQLKQRDYFPHTRFGQFTISIHATEGFTFEGKHYAKDELISFETSESVSSRNKRYNEVMGELKGKPVRMTRGKLQDQEFAFMGMPPQLASLMEKELDLTAKQRSALKEILLKYSSGQRFLRSLTKRRGTEGYSKDAMRVYASYMTSAANHLSRVRHSQEMRDSLGDLSAVSRGRDPVTGNDLDVAERDLTSISELHSYFEKHFQYIMNPKNDWAKVRALGFMWYLGANPKSAFVNMTQVPLVTYPWLASRYGDKQALGAIVKALKDSARQITKGGHLTDDEVAAIEKGRLAGFIDESLATTLPGISEGSTLQRVMPGETGSTMINNVNYYSSWMFHKAEQFNRRAAFLAAYRLARDKGLKTGLAPEAVEAAAYTEGKDSVQSTMFEYAKWNRMGAMRGKQSVIFLFMQYMQQASYLAFGGQGGGTAVRYWLILAGVGGMQGLPFADNLMDIIDLLWRQSGGEGNIRTEIRRYVKDVEMLPEPDTFMHGASRNWGLGPLYLFELLGIPIPNVDVSGSLGMGSPIPALDTLAGESRTPAEKLGRAAVEAGGPIASIAYNYFNFLASSDPVNMKSFERLLPTTLANVSKGVRYLNDGAETMRNGAETTSYRDTEGQVAAIAQMLGFAYTKKNTESERRHAASEAVQHWATKRRIVFNHMWIARDAKDREGIADARKSLKQFNKDVPFSSMRITGSQMKSSMKGRYSQKKDSELERKSGMYKTLTRDTNSAYPDHKE